MRVDVGDLNDLRSAGCLVGKVGTQPVCVVWHEGRAHAVDDRCPHLGFPLHRGSVADGLLTCHWHHARFDLLSGATLDPFADDVRAYPVEIDTGRVVVVVEPDVDHAAHLRHRLVEGLEQGLTLVMAKAVLGLLDAGAGEAEIVRTGIDFGTTYRQQGWGAGLTVLVAMANLAPQLDPDDRALALVHGLAFVSRDTRGRPPRFALEPLGSDAIGGDRLSQWYRRFIETRSPDGAERTLATAVVGRMDPGQVEAMMVAAATDHVFIDEGHSLDFTNKAFEALTHLGWAQAGAVLPTLVAQTASARRAEEEGAWRNPHNLAELIAAATEALPAVTGTGWPEAAVTELAWSLLGEEPGPILDAVGQAVAAGASGEQLGRALALAAALRITRFHVQNDHGDWDIVHHGFTYANALHQSLTRAPSAESLRGVLHGAMKVYLDRFLNVPAARLPEVGPDEGPGDLAELQECWDAQGQVDRAGRIVYRWLRGGGDPARAVATLGAALLAEDAGFHWFQTVEAAVRQAAAWPAGSEEAALILAGAARFLAAHTPTRRELPQVVRIAQRLRRGDPLYEEES